MTWRLAKSLLTLRDQINEAYPDRSRASDGTIGDAAHAATPSDHNPNTQGVVCAFDLTHDPAHGVNTYWLADHIRTHRHPNLKYLVSNGRIASKIDDWAWRTYKGSDPHTSHVHISVGVGTDGKSQQPYDDTTPWDIGTKPKEETMTPTQNEISAIYYAYFGRLPSQDFDWGWYQGKSLTQIIEFYNDNPDILRKKVADGRLVTPGDCSSVVSSKLDEVIATVTKMKG